MSIICLFCRNDVSFLKSILMFTDERTDSEKEVRICSECIKLMNTLMAGKYREQGWQITKDSLVVNIDYNTEKESA